MNIETYGNRLNLANRFKSLFTRRSGYIMMVRRISLDGLDTHEEEM